MIDLTADQRAIADRIHAAVVAARLTHYEPNEVHLSSDLWQRLCGGLDGPLRIWGLPVSEDPGLPPNTTDVTADRAGHLIPAGMADQLRAWALADNPYRPPGRTPHQLGRRDQLRAVVWRLRLWLAERLAGQPLWDDDD
jgi:hypothetical protein